MGGPIGRRRNSFATLWPLISKGKGLANVDFCHSRRRVKKSGANHGPNGGLDAAAKGLAPAEGPGKPAAMAAGLTVSTTSPVPTPQ
jgi:hypothetical protein